SFGEQPLVEVSFDRGERVRVTPEHEWWAMDADARSGGGWRSADRRVTTMELERAPVGRVSEAPELDRDGLRHGIVFGDGHLRRERGYAQVLLQPHKAELASFFDAAPIEVEHFPG